MIRTDYLQRPENMDFFIPLHRKSDGPQNQAEHGFTGNERFC
jgi:hypothetical protein